MSNKLTEYTSDTLLSFMQKVKNKEFCIPIFQRGYVWSDTKIIGFLNSLINHEPFGVIINWKQKKFYEQNDNQFLKDIQCSDEKCTNYIIDGQQRTTTMFILFHYKYYTNPEIIKLIDKKIKDIYFDFLNNCFVKIKSKKIKNNPNYLSAIDLFYEIYKPNLTSEIIKKIPDYFESFVNIYNLFRHIKLGLVHLDNFDIDEALDIFRKFNTEGQKLTKSEIIYSKWIKYNINLNDKFNKLKDYNLLTDNVDNYIDSIFLNIEPDRAIIKSSDQIMYSSNLTNSELEEFFNKFNKAYCAANNYLINNNFNIKTLPSEIIIKWLSYLFYHYPNLSSYQLKILNKYITLISINSFYKSSTNQRLEDNLKFVDLLINQKWTEIDNIFNSFNIKNIDEDIFEDLIDQPSSMSYKFIHHLLFKIGNNFFNNPVEEKDLIQNEKSLLFKLIAPGKYISNNTLIGLSNINDETLLNYYNKTDFYIDLLINDKFQEFKEKRSKFIIDYINVILNE